MKLEKSTQPEIGKYWEGHGGVPAGIICNGNLFWWLILAITPESILKAEWGKYGNLIEGEFSVIDGQHNTQLILAAEPENKIVKNVTSLVIDGHQDLYWPARKETNLIEINLPKFIFPDFHWSSTQYSANDAWCQNFENGYQVLYYKRSTLAARAVRRELIIQ